MTYYSDWTFESISDAVGKSANNLLQQLFLVEELYQRLLTIYQTVGGSDEAFAIEIFGLNDDLGSPVATASQVQKAVDLREAIVAMHNLYEALNGVSISASNKADALRKFAEPTIVGDTRRR